MRTNDPFYDTERFNVVRYPLFFAIVDKSNGRVVAHREHRLTADALCRKFNKRHIEKKLREELRQCQ